MELIIHELGHLISNFTCYIWENEDYMSNWMKGSNRAKILYKILCLSFIHDLRYNVHVWGIWTYEWQRTDLPRPNILFLDVHWEMQDPILGIQEQQDSLLRTLGNIKSKNYTSCYVVQGTKYWPKQDLIFCSLMFTVWCKTDSWEFRNNKTHSWEFLGIPRLKTILHGLCKTST